LEHRSHIPVYLKVADDMRRKISVGEWSGGYQLPGLQILADEYNCSWGTVRNAQQVLVGENLLSPIRSGMATTVTARPSEPSLAQLAGRLRDVQRALDEVMFGLQRAQASRVLIQQEIKPKRGKTPAFDVAVQVVNAGDLPVHNVKLKWHQGSAAWGNSPIDDHGSLLPQQAINSSREYPATTNFDVSGAVVTFQDAEGANWLRRPDGELLEWQDQTDLYHSDHPDPP
jgi:DNA-binding transcriptional regulator YhcF (GntR family)